MDRTNNTEAAVIAAILVPVFLALAFGMGHAVSTSATMADCKTMGVFRAGGETFECRKK